MRTRNGRYAWLLACAAGLTATLMPVDNAMAAAIRRPRAGVLTLVRDGQPAATILIASNATRAAQFAAFELQTHIRLVTDAELPIVREGSNAPVSGVRILVGASRATEAMGLPGKPFGPLEYLIQFRPGTLVLMGDDAEDFTTVVYNDQDPFAFRTWPEFLKPRSTCHAVYDFLERHAGVRWFRPGPLGMTYPRQDTLTVSGADVRRAPFFKHSEPSYFFGNSEGYDLGTGLWQRPGNEPRLDVWEARAYPNLQHWKPGSWHYTHAKRGEIRRFLLRMRAGGEPYACNHSFYGYYQRFLEKAADPKAAALFERAEPAWFAQGYEGKPPQMCYLNEAFIQQAIQDARDYFDGKGAKPGATAAGDYFGLVPMDNSSYCKCPKCQAMRRPIDPATRQFSNGEWSDYMFRFVDRVAREVGRTHPGKILSSLAYASYAHLPENVDLASNVSVGFCLHTRNNWSKPTQQNDLDLFDSWIKRYPDRRYFLFLYYCFPVENAHNGRWHCFPGFFARGIDTWFKRFQHAGVRGAYFCGFGQDVEAYVTFKLLDNPALKLDAILDDYFRNLYPRAAGPMRRLYDEIERIYSSPESYPEGFKGHQTEAIAWEHLGKPANMARLADLMGEVRAAAADASDIERQRLALFESGVWDYMQAGANRYAARQWRAANRPAGARVPFAPRGAAPDDEAAWTNACMIELACTESGEPAMAKGRLRLRHDGQDLHALFEEAEATAAPAAGWDLLIAIRPDLPFDRITIRRDGTIETRRHGDNSGAPTLNARAMARPGQAGKPSAMHLVVPLASLASRGVEPGWTVYANAVRRAADERHAVWMPNAVDAEVPAWFGALHLELGDAPSVPSLPAAAAATAKAPAAAVGSNATVRTVDIFDLNLAIDDALQGRPYVLETPRVNAWFRGKHNSPDGTSALSDARTPRSPTEDLYIEGAPVIVYRWDLGAVPPEGRRLEKVRLWWSAADSARNAVKVRFAVRDAASGLWREITETLATPKIPGRGNTFRVLEVDFSARAITGFDALRMIDVMGGYNPRLVELDVLTRPASAP